MLPSFSMLVASLTMQAGLTQYTLGLWANASYTTNQGQWAPLSASALQVSPTLGIAYTDRSLGLSLSYFPLMTLIPSAPPPQLLHQAELAVGNRPGSRTGVAAKVHVAYGTNNFRLQQVVPSSASGTGTTGGTGTGSGTGGGSGTGTGGGGTGTTGGSGTPTPTPPPTVQPIPLAPSLKYLNASAGASITSRLGARLIFQGEAAYVAQGGADQAARETLPLGRGPTLGLTLSWQAARDHLLTTALSASYWTFLRTGPDPNAVPGVGSDAWATVLDESWRYRLGSATTLSLAAGVGTTGNAVDFANLVVRRVMPAGKLGLDDKIGVVTGSIWLRVAPYVDYTSGIAYERADASLYLGWPPHRNWMLEGTASGGEALAGVQRGQVTATAQVAARWQAARWARLFFGLSTLWQRAGVAYPASSFQQWTLFLGGAVAEGGRF